MSVLLLLQKQLSTEKAFYLKKNSWIAEIIVAAAGHWQVYFLIC